MDMQHILKKPTLLELLNQHHISAFSLARVSQIHIDVVRALIWGTEYVPPETAKRIIVVFNKMAKASYTLEQLDLAPISPERGRKDSD